MLVNSALNSPTLASYAEAVLKVEGCYVRARLIELAALVAQRDEAEAAAG